VTRVARLLHLDDGEFPALRAQIEARPIPAPPAKKPLGWGPAMLAYLRALDVAAEPNIAPFVQTDWSARLANDWEAVDARLAKLDVRTKAEMAGFERSWGIAVCMLTQPLLSELAEFKAVTLVNWRQALRVHAEAELALCDAELAVAL